MKNQFRGAAILMGMLVSGAAFCGNSVPAGTKGAGGVVEFSGEIVDVSCNVSSVNGGNKVDLGKWAISYFTGTSTETTKTPFNISVDNCPTSVTDVAVLLDGQKDATDPTLLAVTGGATGVGIKLYNGGASGSQINLGTVSASVPVTSGKATVPFFADYKSTGGSITSGDANGVANFLMVYN
ncbi:fimbrial protein [Leclercia adecarboxylata]|uniref:fimbrial protein n=1 Tax=Leclercia adecarboxylata TaxID=83655 RepID=UPI002DBBBAB3|nr:fimbrial protein [Leclercia adecarboxylata]MEB6379020.1 fimbrial protein [Leclercia adecarboxylata]